MNTPLLLASGCSLHRAVHYHCTGVGGGVAWYIDPFACGFMLISF